MFFARKIWCIADVSRAVYPDLPNYGRKTKHIDLGRSKPICSLLANAKKKPAFSKTSLPYIYIDRQTYRQTDKKL